jgi:hypothetical protein
VTSWVRGPWLAALAPFIVAGLLAAAWTRAGVLRLTGDEPHYLIMADSLVRDTDLRLENNYERDCATGDIFGCVTPHGFDRPGARIVPYHQPGLSWLVAMPFAIGGVLWARLAMCAIAGLLAVYIGTALARRLEASEARWLAFGVFFAVPCLAGSSAIYPDLIAGLLTLALALWLMRDAAPQSSSAAAAFWILAGSLPWLNLKFLLATVVLAAWAFLQRPADRATRWRVLPLFILAGPVSLAVVHYDWFGTVWGFRGGGELTDAPLRALMIFLGLHLDQGQGMFFQNPVLLVGIPCLVIWLRREPLAAGLWLALYLSLIVPNAFQMARFGGGPTGRFGWSAASMWMIPMVAASVTGHLDRRVLRAVVGAAGLYQVLLGLRWFHDPTVLLAVLDERVWARDSLFPLPLRQAVPSFYFWDFQGYLTYVPNVLAVIGLVLLGATPWHRLLHARVARAAGVAWLSFVVLCAALLPVVPRASDRGPEHAGGQREALRAARSAMVLRFEAERMSPSSLTTQAVADADASGGYARASASALAGLPVLFGPYLDLAAGRYQVDLVLRHAAAPLRAESIGVFEVTADSGRVTFDRRSIPNDRRQASYAPVTVVFEAAAPVDGVEFRFHAHPDAPVLIDYIELRPAPRPAP